MLNIERILSLDLSTTCSGWAIFQNGIMSSSGIVKLKKGNWLEMVEELIELLSGSIDQVIIEDGYVGANPNVSLNIGKLRGCVEWICRGNRVYFKQFKPLTWKKYHNIKNISKKKAKETGQLNPKEQSIKLVFDKYNLIVKDDESDAILLGEYYCNEGWKK